MARYTDALAQANWLIKCMIGMTAAATTVAALALFALRSAQQDLTLHIPPNLANGAQIHVGKKEVPHSNVYLFAFYIWQQLNRWSKNGQQDYGAQIYNLQAFFTPACQQQLLNDLSSRANQGELDQRTRSIMEIPGIGFSDSRVAVLSDGSWNVVFDTQVIETSRGIAVKDTFIRYPVHVVRYDVDRERNPWQLAVDCYAAGAKPERLDPKAVEIAVSNKGSVVKNSDDFANKSFGDGGVSKDAAAPLSAPQAQSGNTNNDPATSSPSPPQTVAPATLPRLVK